MIASLPNELWWKIIDHAIPFRSNLAMVDPSLERLHPFFPGRFSGFGDTDFYSSQVDIWKRGNMVARNFVQVNRLWRGNAERFLYSAFYVDEEWRVQRFIDAVKLNPNLAKLLRTFVVMPRICVWGVKEACFGTIVEQVLSLCHGINAIVVRPPILSSSLPFFQFSNSSRRLRLLSALRLPNAEFHTFMISFNNYTNLQVLELSVSAGNGHTLSSFPEHITFPSLHTLALGYLDSFVPEVVGKWELPSLKSLSISRWYPHVTRALLPLIQSSCERLEFFDACLDLLHDPAFHDLIRAPPVHLTNVTLNIATSADSSPPMYPAIKPFFGHIVTLGISKFPMIGPENHPAWDRFFSDPTYIPHLLFVLTDMQASSMDLLFPFGKLLKDRGVVAKGVTDDNLSFVPIRLPQKITLKVSMFLLSNESMLILSPASKCFP